MMPSPLSTICPLDSQIYCCLPRRATGSASAARRRSPAWIPESSNRLWPGLKRSDIARTTRGGSTTGTHEWREHPSRGSRPPPLAIPHPTDVLFSVARPHVPRVVADPGDPYRENLLSSSSDRLSEFAAAERHFLMRYRRGSDIEDLKRSERLAELRRHPDLVIVDLDPTEAEDM